MSLVIDLFDPASGDYAYLNAVEHDAAGFERYRSALWGARALKERGARFFPQLNHGDLFVYPADLDAFTAECQMILGDAAAIADEADGPDAEQLRRYMTRFLTIITEARDRGVGVCIS